LPILRILREPKILRILREPPATFFTPLYFLYPSLLSLPLFLRQIVSQIDNSAYQNLNIHKNLTAFSRQTEHRPKGIV
ncbi:MAG: hypothetical protein ACI3YC_07400, partial [Alloprevotella sp.]